MKSDPTLLVAVCDDNNAVLAETCLLVEKCLAPYRHRVEAFTDPEALLQAANYKRYGLAILDIRLKEQSGIRVAGELQERNPGCGVIFLTAYVDYAQDVYDVKHVGFVLKDNMKTRLPVAIRRFFNAENHSEEKNVTINEYGTLRLLRQSRIRFLERHLRTTDVHTVDGDFATVERLELILARLDDTMFCQCHKSYIINWSYVESFSGEALYLVDGAKVPVSRRNTRQVREKLFRYAMREDENPAESAAPPEPETTAEP